MKELYFVAIVPGGEIEKDVHRYKLDLHQRFGTKVALKAPAHITLFPPFRFEKEQEELLFRALQSAVEEATAFPVALENFSFFPPRVVYVNVKQEGSALAKLEQSVINCFSALPGMKAQTARPFVPHMTIGNRDWHEGGYETARKEYEAKEYSAIFTVEKIALLRLDHGKWEIIAETKLITS